MTSRPSPADLDRMARELLRAANFRDIESPSGMIESAIIEDTDGTAAYLDQARAWLWEARFIDVTQRRIWELHADGMPVREIAREVFGQDGGMARERVSRTISRVRAAMLGHGGKRRGRPRDPNSKRQGGTFIGGTVAPAAVLALDHLRFRLKLSMAAAIERALIEIANKI